MMQRQDLMKADLLSEILLLASGVVISMIVIFIVAAMLVPSTSLR